MINGIDSIVASVAAVKTQSKAIQEVSQTTNVNPLNDIRDTVSISNEGKRLSQLANCEAACDANIAAISDAIIAAVEG